MASVQANESWREKSGVAFRNGHGILCNCAVCGSALRAKTRLVTPPNPLGSDGTMKIEVFDIRVVDGLPYCFDHNQSDLESI